MSRRKARVILEGKEFRIRYHMKGRAFIQPMDAFAPCAEFNL